MTDRTRATTPTATEFDRTTWQSDAVPDTPIRELSFPGTHHAAMVDPDPASTEYLYCQTKDVYTQLTDGVRFLDVRVESHGDGEETEFYGHHAAETGRSLDDEVFPQIAQFLSEVDAAGGNELVLLKLSHFRDDGLFSDTAFEADDWAALSELLTATFDDYVIDLGSMISDDLLGTTLSAFDGPKIAVFYRTVNEHDNPLSLPSFTAPFSDWVSSYYPDTPTPGNVLAGGVTNEHTDTSKLGETQWIIRAPTDLYEGGQETNGMLTLFEQVARAAPAINPNVIRVDYYETSPIVALCRRLSLDGLHEPSAYTPRLDPGVYSLESEATGNVVEVEAGGTADGTDVVEASWTNSAHERLAIQRNDDGTYLLEAQHSGDVIGVANESTSDGGNVHQWSWTGDDTQRWYAVEVDKERYCFINANSGRVLDGEPSSANVLQWHWHSGSNQQWHAVDRGSL